MSSFISIIIPTFNEEGQIASLISDIKTSTIGRPYEIIVVDGGSTDNTVREVNFFNVKLLKSPQKGRGAQLNYGASQAQGKLLFFLHADSNLSPNFLHSIHESVDNGFDAGCFRLKFDSENLFLKANAWLTRFNVTAFRFGDQGLFVTRDLFERSGGYRNDMVVLEDQEIVKRLKKFGARFCVRPEHITTSARKYTENGPFKLQFTFLLVWINYKRGKSQQDLIKLYKKRISDNRITESDARRSEELVNDIYQKPDSGEGENAIG